MVPIDSAWVISYSTAIDPIIVSVTIFEILTCSIDDLELGQFKVVQGQRLCCQSIAYG